MRAAEPWGADALFRVLLVVLDELWHYLLHGTVDDVVGYLVDGGLWVGVDGDDDA